MKRLTRRIISGNADCAYCTHEYTPDRKGCSPKCELWEAQLEKLASYEDAEEQGLLLRLPCKVGDAVYSCECGMIVRDFVHSFSTDANGLWAINIYGGIIGLFDLSVFTTLEEAEQALKEGAE